MENIMKLYECKFDYLDLALAEIYKKYYTWPSFRLSLPNKYEITTSALFEDSKFSKMQNGLYVITNIWLYQDKFYGPLVSFKFMYSPIEEVLVYYDGRYDIIETIFSSKHDKDALMLLLVENGTKKMFRRTIKYKDVANIYEIGNMNIYELTYPAGMLLKDIWWLDCNELKNINYKQYMQKIIIQVQRGEYPKYIYSLFQLSKEA
jgi:hypothetical protein